MASYFNYFSSENNRIFKTKKVIENSLYFSNNDYAKRTQIDYIAFTNFRSATRYNTGKKYSNVGIFICVNSNEHHSLILKCENKNILKLYHLIENYIKSFNQENILNCLDCENLTSDIKLLINGSI